MRLNPLGRSEVFSPQGDARWALGSSGEEAEDHPGNGRSAAGPGSPAGLGQMTSAGSAGKGEE